MNKNISIFFLVLLLTSQANSHDTIPCHLCNFSVDIIKYEIKFTNNTIAIIGDIVDVLCYALGGKNVGDICKDIVSNTEEIITDIDNGMDPMEICTDLGFC
jgi:hypothetical protein